MTKIRYAPAKLTKRQRAEERQRHPIQWRHSGTSKSGTWTLIGPADMLIPGREVQVMSRNGLQSVMVGAICDTYPGGKVSAMMGQQIPGWIRNVLSRNGASYRQHTDGDWYVAGPAALMVPGATVTVQTKAGAEHRRSVQSVVWEGHNVVLARCGWAKDWTRLQPWETDQDRELPIPDAGRDVDDAA